jgi:hypothetical protein
MKREGVRHTHIRSVVLMASLLLLLAAGMVTADGAAAPVLPPLPTYNCLEALERPVINGRLNDPIWEEAPEIHLVDCVTGAPAKQATVFRMVWHDNYLYVAARAAETDIQDHNLKRNDLVFGEQCLEVYLVSPIGMAAYDGDAWNYLETDVSPTGVMWNGRIQHSRPNFPQPGQSYSFASDDTYQPADLIARTTMRGTLNNSADTDRGWRLEMQIPLAGPPWGCAPDYGELWRINLYRVHNMAKPDQELQAWSPTGITGFHVPQRFGYLHFVKYPERPTIWPWSLAW